MVANRPTKVATVDPNTIVIAALPPEQWDEQVTDTAKRNGEDQPVQMVYTEVIAAAINYDFTAEHHPPAEQGTDAVKLADLAARLDQRQATLADRRARDEAFTTVADAIRTPPRARRRRPLRPPRQRTLAGPNNDAATNNDAETPAKTDPSPPTADHSARPRDRAVGMLAMVRPGRTIPPLLSRCLGTATTRRTQAQRDALLDHLEQGHSRHSFFATRPGSSKAETTDGPRLRVRADRTRVAQVTRA